jgi:hypothetical protein
LPCAEAERRDPQRPTLPDGAVHARLNSALLMMRTLGGSMAAATPLTFAPAS